MKLRKYQLTAVNTTLTGLNANKRIVLVSPTGSGKTVMAAEIARRVKKADKTLVAISHRKEINEQLSKKLGCSVFSIQSIYGKNMEKYLKPALVLLDECHHYKAPEWSRIFEAFSGSKFLGLTATPTEGLGEYFDGLVVAAQYPELVKAGYLSKVRLIRPDHFCGPDLWQSPVTAYQHYCQGERAFLFAPTKEASLFYAQQFSDAGIKAVHLDADTPREERTAALELFRGLDVDVICNIQILTEGVDVPEASCCILAGNSSTVESYLQKTGRVLRPHPTKDWATVLDLVGSSWLYGSPIDRRSYTLSTGTKNYGKLDGVRDCPQCAWCGDPVKVCPNCGWDFFENSTAKRKRQAKILNKELKEVWCGMQTPKVAKDKEWKRLCYQAKVRDHSTLWWAAATYKKTFEETARDRLTQEQKDAIYLSIAERVLKKGNKMGQAYYIYKELLSESPRSQLVSAVNEVRKEDARTKLL